MFDFSVDQKQLQETAKQCKERGIRIPTLAEMRSPEKIPEAIKKDLKNIGLWDLHPRNLYRITWKNEPVERGGGFGNVNALCLPSELTGVKAPIVGMLGKWFPTGAHKVGATFGCLVPKLVTGQFDPKSKKAVWPSTGNFCRGGAYVSALLGCKSIAILPEGMSRERFEWLSKVAGEVIATPGCESNVKEIFDKCWELKKSRNDIIILNQFEEFGNCVWHYHVTGPAMVEAAQGRIAGIVLSSGSGGTLSAGYYIKKHYPQAKLGVAEALQCPTLLENGFGAHRIEGIGDKHVPWIHDLKLPDMVIAADDELVMRVLRLFNEPEGRTFLRKQGVKVDLISKLDQIGISGIGNMVSAIKFAKYYELTSTDRVMTVFTDSMALYHSRIQELTSEKGKYSEIQAARDYEALLNLGQDSMAELRYPDKKRIHNLKYYTWVEQQGRRVDELNRQWSDHDAYWAELDSAADTIDSLIAGFNSKL